MINPEASLLNNQNSMKLKFKKLLIDSNRLILYRNLLDDKIIGYLLNIIKELSKDEPDESTVEKNYYELTHDLIIIAENENLSGNILKAYIMNSILKDENIFAISCEKHNNDLESLYELAFKDISVLKRIMDIDTKHLRSIMDSDDETIENYTPTLYKDERTLFSEYREELLNIDSVPELLDSIIGYYYKIGSGELVDHIAFKWNNKTGFSGIKYCDLANMENIVGYTYQKEILLKNTSAFIEGNPANNMLLVGSRGTGKSSLVKSLVKEYYLEGLRIIELKKSQLKDFELMMDHLRNRNKKFIVFLDDLSFEDTETEYKELKSILEGSLEKKPENVIIYATSNRRNLIKESWSERDSDIHSNDSINEKMSLSDRFGITLSFYSPTQEEYLNMVKKLALENGISPCKQTDVKFYSMNIGKLSEQTGLIMAWETLREDAIKWGIAQNGFSGRTAKQFIDYIIGTYKN
ncbi:ATP-binding protein [Methanococcus sp. CF]